MRQLRSLCIGWPVVLSIAVALVSVIAPAGRSTDYYFQTGGSLNDPNSWTTGRGGGTAAPNFSTDGNTFVIQSGQSPALAPSLATPWVIAGIGSGLLIETGGAMDPSNNNP